MSRRANATHLVPAPRIAIDVRLDDAARRRALAVDVARGLTGTPKTLPPKYFYDARGSALFERITQLPEYYPTRVERAILRGCAGALMDALAPDDIVEIGAGSGEKVALLLDARSRRDATLRYVPVDVDGVTMEAAAHDLVARYPGLEVHGLVGDFERHLPLVPSPRGRRLVLFLGSTIGNLDPPAQRGLLRRLSSVVGGRGRLLLGVDLVKEPRVLEAAYDDAAGVTREFNRNVLHVMNAALGADFVPDTFRHVARWDAASARVEMHLVPDVEQRVHLRALGLRVTIGAGERLWTESAYKFTRASVDALLADAGFTVEAWHTDRAARFAVVVGRPGRGKLS